MDLDNEKRLIASQILVELFDARQLSQLKLLEAQIKAAITTLEKS